MEIVEVAKSNAAENLMMPVHSQYIYLPELERWQFTYHSTTGASDTQSYQPTFRNSFVALQGDNDIIIMVKALYIDYQ